MAKQGKVVGGLLGLLGGGPIGALVGASLGNAFDQMTSNASRPNATSPIERPVRCRVTQIPYGTAPADGLRVTIRFDSFVPDGAYVHCWLRNGDGSHGRSRSPFYSDEVGAVLFATRVSDRKAEFFIPYGVCAEPSKIMYLVGAVGMQMEHDTTKMVSESFYVTTSIPTRSWAPVRHISSLLVLAVGMALVDDDLATEEMALIISRISSDFAIDKQDPRFQADLEHILQHDLGSASNLNELIDDLRIRHPTFVPYELIVLLAGIAKADGLFRVFGGKLPM